MAELLLVNPSRAKRKVKARARRSNPISKADAKRVKAALKSPHVTKKEKASLRSAIKAMHKADQEAARAGVKPRKRKTTKRKAAVAKTSRKSKKSHSRKTAHKVARRSTRKMAKRVKFTRTQARKYTRKSRRVHRSAKVLGKRSAAKRIYGINPLNLGGLKNLAVPALIGATGGFAINVAFDKLETQTWYPDMLKNEWGKAAAKAALAIGASMALSKVKMISPANRTAALGGALVIIAYDLLDGTLFPKVKEALGMDGYQLAGYQDVAGLGEFEYVDPTDEGDMAGLGYVGSAPVVGFTPAQRTYTG